MGSPNLKAIDSHLSWKVLQIQVDLAVKKGELTREKASQVLKNARDAYSRQDYNRVIERIK